jgi:hypothetical protein
MPINFSNLLEGLGDHFQRLKKRRGAISGESAVHEPAIAPPKGTEGQVSGVSFNVLEDLHKGTNKRNSFLKLSSLCGV